MLDIRDLTARTSESRRHTGTTRSHVATGAGALLFLATAMFALSCGSPQSGSHQSAAVRDPNVMLIVVDALRSDHLGCYGYERATSPNTDRLAEGAVLFETVIAPSTFTKTSIASLFTGLYPHRHGVYTGNLEDEEGRVTSDVLAEELDTLAEALTDRGYATAAWVHNAHIKAFTGFGQGFSLYQDLGMTMESMRVQARHWYRGLPEDQPFFIYLHIIELHDPYRPPPPYDVMFGLWDQTIHDFDVNDWMEYREEVELGLRKPGGSELDQIRAQYDGLIAAIDATLGKLLVDLEADGAFDDTLIILTSDHGEAFMEHGFLRHSNVPYEELVRIPLIIKPPGKQDQLRRIPDQVSLVEVKPTVLDFIGVADRAPGDGRSLLPFLSTLGASSPSRSAEFHITETDNSVAVRGGGWKYIEKKGRQPELYNLLTDPAEQRNLASDPTHAEIRIRWADVVRETRTIRDSLPEGSSVELDPDTVRQLEVLGYLDPQ